MATQHRHNLSRLNIPPPLNAQMPPTTDNRSLFTPALQTGFASNFPLYALNSAVALQTPMQTAFFQHPPGAPSRPMHGHRASNSMAHLGMPMTPLTAGGFPSRLPGQPSFVPKSRRTPSMSTGGPPKALLGGPNRNQSPAVLVAAALEKAKLKKTVVKLPVEKIDEDGSATPSLWVRIPLEASEIHEQFEVLPPEICTAEIVPDDSSRTLLPPNVDVFLPGKTEWTRMRNMIIEAKLQKLGVEKGVHGDFGPSDSFNPHIRAASISSPADPALLMFKLNKLQQAQSSSNSLSTSPQPPNLTLSPNSQLPPRLQNRHGYSMSLAPSGALQSSFEVIQSSTDDEIQAAFPSNNVYAPQGRAPVMMNALNIPSAPSRAESRPDFIRGFGLDIPEEEEEEASQLEETEIAGETNSLPSQVSQDEQALEDEEGMQDMTHVKPDEIHRFGHLKQASRVSVALSVGSMNVAEDDEPASARANIEMGGPVHNIAQAAEEQEHETDFVNEWTGSEDVKTGVDASDDEQSIGEWSNPSDEERARRQRLNRRLLRQAQTESEIPRRIPKFPRPPDAEYITYGSDDDILSNPSDEMNDGFGVANPAGQPVITNTFGRPLPPLPHSRNPSAHLSGGVHSHHTSEHFGYQAHHSALSATSASGSLGHRDSLNPNAKPFVFGARTGTTFIPSIAANQLHGPSSHVHPPVNSAPQLNAAAQEFKPSGFTFKPPVGVPEVTFTQSTTTNDTIEAYHPTTENSSSRPEQGREKRQRTDSIPGDEADNESDIEQRTSLSTFKFPPDPDSPPRMRRSAPVSPQKDLDGQRQNIGNVPKSGTFSGFPYIVPEPTSQPQEFEAAPIHALASSPDCYTDSVSDLDEDNPSLELPKPGSQKLKRAPIPLDFKHPVSTNMVPAGLFKNVSSTDAEERVRSATIRQRFGSREIFDNRRPSLDDNSVPAISRKVSRQHILPDRDQDKSEKRVEPIQIVSPIARMRRSSLPISNSATDSVMSPGSIIPPEVKGFDRVVQDDDRIEAALDRKFETLQRDLMATITPGNRGISENTEELVRDAIALFRSQMQTSAAQALDHGHADAQGELDFDLIKDIIDQSLEESRAVLKSDLNELIQKLPTMSSLPPDLFTSHVTTTLLQNLKNILLSANESVIRRLDTLEALTTTRGTDPENLITDLSNALLPQITSLRSEPIDYDGLTWKLSQAVKPHITQLIDLASDKRETAELIKESLIPVLQALIPPSPTFDTDALTGQITANIQRIIGPIDTHRIKEEVADLVVERLDSRLAVRDMSMSADYLVTQIAGDLAPHMERLDRFSSELERSLAPSAPPVDLSPILDSISKLSSGIPVDFTMATTGISELRRLVEEKTSELDSLKHLESIKSTLDLLSASRERLTNQSDDLLFQSRETMVKLSVVPESLEALKNHLDASHSEVLAKLQLHQEADELRNLSAANADLQVQLAKARGAHGQVRVEKDNLNEHLLSVEEERDRLRAQVNDMQCAAVKQAEEYHSLQLRMTEQEHAMHTSLERLKAADVTSQSQQERIVALEKLNHDLVSQNGDLKHKITRLESKVELAIQGKDATLVSLHAVESERDRLQVENTHWEDFRHTASEIQVLLTAVSKYENEGAVELQRTRDRVKTLETENSALQKRIKDQESKVTNMERASTTSRQGLAQAQQKASEWEKKARDFEIELEILTTKYEHSESIKAQLEDDYTNAQLQLQEQAEEEGHLQDRERELRKDISSLQLQITRLNSDSLQARLVSNRAPSGPWVTRKDTYSRAPSRASTNYNEPQTPRVNGRALDSSPDPATSTWDSMHAPKAYYGASSTASKIDRSLPNRVASPTASVVSVAPTLGDDGWYS